ncbi:MAG TPA: ABC transporter ATP-binding protein [Alkalispirochaeta sp.]|nr:ABC transporter ATP-binding protein [Alkalispirochaeta sp.]
MNSIMQVRDLVKHYGTVRAVDGVSFEIPEGICFGLLGPNGAGKTTTIEMMEGILKGTSGEILFRGEPIGQRFREKVGIQFQSTALPEYITVRETLKMFHAFYPDPRAIEDVIHICSLDDIINRDNRKLSGGQRQRLLLALAIVPNPEIVFLDEPTTGLDPQARRNFWELIRRIRAEGTTVVLTTHYMDEAQLLCDQVAIMDHGHLLELDTPDRLLNKHFEGVVVRVPLEHEEVMEMTSNNLDQTLQELLAGDTNLDDLSIHKPNLEDLFIKLTGSSLRA